MSKAVHDTLGTIAFIGTGLMGEPMATRLLSAGYKLAVWNRTRAKTQRLSARGARVAETPQDAVEGADAIITMLADGPAVTDVIGNNAFGVVAAHAVVIDMSSIPPALAREHGNYLASRSIGYLDAPVSGGTQGAAEGTLAIMVGGAPATFEAVRPLLEVMGHPTLVGPTGSGQLAKLANQAIVACTIGAVAEALLLAAAGGADPRKVREALMGGFADSRILKVHGLRMVDRAWIPGGLLRTQVKDLRAITALAADLGLKLTLVTEIAALFESGLEAGLGSCDHSALLLELERQNPGIRMGAGVDQRPVQP